MTTPTDADSAAPAARERYQLLVLLITFVAVVGAFAWGFDGGMKIAGPGLGIAMALNMAFFAGLLCGWLADKLLGPKASDTRKRL